MDEEEIGEYQNKRTAKIGEFIRPLLFVGFFLVGWALYKRIKR